MSDSRITNTILVVDDAPENIDLLDGVLNKDYKIKAALNGEKALKIAGSENPPDIILLDIEMPGMDGYEVCRRLKADPQTRDIPIIFVTAKSDESDETKGLEIGAVDYITKPFSPPIVRARLKTHLALKNNLEELYQKNQMLNARANELTSINRLAEKTSSSLNMHEVLQAVCDELVKIFNIRNAGIGLFDKARAKLKIVAFRSSDPEEKDATGIELRLQDFEATRIVIKTKQPIAIENAQTDPRTKPIHSIMRELGTLGLLIVPIISLKEVIGTIGMPAKHPGQIFTNAEIELAKTIASQVASSIENARLYTQIEQALDIAEHDLEIGRQIQAGFLPRTMPKIPKWELVSYYVAARQVAGDFFDAFRIGKNDKIGLIVADVCDKGVGAALFMVVFRSLIRAFSEDRQFNDNSEEFLLSIVSTVNKYIATIHDSSNMFATMFFGVLEPEKNVLFYVNAGHELPLIVDAEGNLKKLLDSTGPAIGFMPDLTFTVDKVVMERGDVLVAYTDGAVDARNIMGESLSEETFISYIKKPYPSAYSLLKHIENQITEHMSGTRQFDDITMLALRRKQSANDEKHEITQLAKMENLPTLKGFIEQASIHMDLDENVTFALKLAVDEACTNIITHGYGGADPGPIKLTFESDSEKAKLTIYDEGISFNPENAVEADIESDWEERQIGGLGLLMIREMIDEINYESGNGMGNFLILTKHINSK
jgi:sigma-B regulation protein RsbU (phosphoserine phosphatase)